MMGLSQAAYIKKVLSRFSMDNSKKGMLPFRHGLAFSRDQCPKTQEERDRMAGVPMLRLWEVSCMRCSALDQISVLLLAW